LEEPPPLFRARLVELGLAEAADLLVLDPEGGLPSIDQLASLEAAITEGKIDILFADPLIDFFQVADENDATEMARAFRQLRAAIRRTGCTVVLIHHDHKGEGKGIGLVRGSTAITGAADVIMQVSAPFGETDPRRHIEVRGRYGLAEFDAVLAAGCYQLLTPEDVARRGEAERAAKKRARKAAKEHAREEAVDRAAEHLLAHPEGATRGEAITALALPVNEAKAILDLAVLKIAGRVENGAGSRPTKWFPPEVAEDEREGGTDHA
jgi:RecA-family ATPase